MRFKVTNEWQLFEFNDSPLGHFESSCSSLMPIIWRLDVFFDIFSVSSQHLESLLPEASCIEPRKLSCYTEFGCPYAESSSRREDKSNSYGDSLSHVHKQVEKVYLRHHASLNSLPYTLFGTHSQVLKPLPR